MKEEKKESSSKPNPKSELNLARVSGITFEVLALNLGMMGLGYYLDNRSDTAFPWILFLSVFLSTGATIYYLIKKFS